MKNRMRACLKQLKRLRTTVLAFLFKCFMYATAVLFHIFIQVLN